LPLVSIISDNANDTARANVLDTIIVSITADEPITMPVVHIAGSLGASTGVGQAYPGPSFMQYTTVYTVVAADVVEGNSSVSIVFEDSASNDGVTVLSVTDDSVVAIDLTPPTLPLVSIISDNANNSVLASGGDTLTLSFVADETIMRPTVFILGQAANVRGVYGRFAHSSGFSYSAYNATYTVVSSDVVEGTVDFVIIFEDLASNTGVSVQRVTDNSAVSVDLTRPTLVAVSLTSNNAAGDAFRATVGEIVTLDWTFSEPTVAIPVVSFNGTVVHVTDLTPPLSGLRGTGLVYRATYTVTPSDHSGFWMNFVIDGFKDAAGNRGIEATATMDDSAVFVDQLAPVFANCAMLDILGSTDAGKNFGTETHGSLQLIYPTVSDNAPAESLPITALVNGVVIDNSTDGIPSTYQFPYQGVKHKIRTNITFSVTDRAGLNTQCTVDVTIVDNEPPLMNCTDRDVNGWTVDGVNYGTEVNKTLSLQYSTVWDNSGETLDVIALVNSERIDNTYRFPYTELTQHGWTTVTYSATDSSGLTSTCDVSVTVVDNQVPLIESNNNCSHLHVLGVTDPGKPYSTVATGSVTLLYPSIWDNSGENISAIPHVQGTPIDDDFPFPYVGVEGNMKTQVMYRAWDKTGNAQNCLVNVTIVDNQPPVLQDCASINTPEYRATLGSSDLVYPTVTDNSGEVLKVYAYVGQYNITDIRPPRELGAAGQKDVQLRVNSDGSLDIVATVTFNASDSSGLVTTCRTETVLDIVDDCENQPCHHSAKCINKPVHGYRCICAPGYTSTNCDMLARAVIYNFAGGITNPTPLQIVMASHLAREIPGGFDQQAVDQVLATRFVQSSYSTIIFPSRQHVFAKDTVVRFFREAIASVFTVDVSLVRFHNASHSHNDADGVGYVAVEYSLHGDEDVRPLLGSPRELASAFEDAVVALHTAGHTGAHAIPHFPGSFNRTRCAEVLPDDQVWCGHNATNVVSVQGSVLTEVGLTIMINMTEVENQTIRGLTGTSFERELFTQLTRTTAIQTLLATATGSITTSLTAKVLQIGECHQGLEIDQSSRGLATPCAGRVGNECNYECGYGYNAFGTHVCGADGVFAGGICTPLGQVPMSCNGNIRVIPTSTITSVKLSESSSSQHRAFLHHEELCQALPEQSSCGAGGCFPLKPNE
jgi:hypothetical protein